MEASHEWVFARVDGQLGERVRTRAVVFFPRPVQTSDCERLPARYADGLADMLFLFPTGLEEVEHRNQAELGLGPG